MATPNIAAAGIRVVPKVLYSGRLAGITAAAVYTVPIVTAAVIKSAWAVVVGGAPVRITAGIVPAGGTADGTHEVLHQYLAGLNEDLPVGGLVGVMLGAGDAISFTQSIDASVDVVLTGVELS